MRHSTGRDGAGTPGGAVASSSKDDRKVARLRPASAPRCEKSPLSRLLFPALGMILLAACAPLPSYRYEITVEVDTPSGLRTGSSVIEISGHREPKLLPDMMGAALNVRGEAAAVDLPDGRTIFALLAGGRSSGGGAASIGVHLLTPAEKASMSQFEAGSVLGKVQRTVELPRQAYPLLVTFRDPADPNTIEAVDPESTVQFGPGGRLKRITISSTRKPVTEGIRKRLPWVSEQTPVDVKNPDGVRLMIGAQVFKSLGGAMHEDVFLAAAAMDAYNRAGVGKNKLTIATDRIGNATVISISERLVDGFLGVSYVLTDYIGTLDAGTTVIAYRGTDGVQDVLSAWPGMIHHPKNEFSIVWGSGALALARGGRGTLQKPYFTGGTPLALRATRVVAAAPDKDPQGPDSRQSATEPPEFAVVKKSGNRVGCLAAANQAKFLALAAIFGLTSCSEIAIVQCPEGSAISDRALVDLAVGKIVRQSLASGNPDAVRYASRREFHEQNPDCCFVSRPERFQGGVFSLPIKGEVELTIRYRRSTGKVMPYRLRHVAIGPCPSNMEESEQRLSAQQLEASKHQLLGRKVN